MTPQRQITRILACSSVGSGLIRPARRPGLGVARLRGGGRPRRLRRRLRRRRFHRRRRRLARLTGGDRLGGRAHRRRGSRGRRGGRLGDVRRRLRRGRRTDGRKQLREARRQRVVRGVGGSGTELARLLRVTDYELLEVDLLQDHRQLVVMEKVQHGVLEQDKNIICDAVLKHSQYYV